MNLLTTAESGVWWNRRRKKITSIGSEFQADILEWKNDTYESDSKWLGTRIWPLDKSEQRRILIERDPIGKGRKDTCGCEYLSSYDCIRFHLSEKQRKLKLELGSAFYHWKFDCMGDELDDDIMPELTESLIRLSGEGPDARAVVLYSGSDNVADVVESATTAVGGHIGYQGRMWMHCSIELLPLVGVTLYVGPLGWPASGGFNMETEVCLMPLT